MDYIYQIWDYKYNINANNLKLTLQGDAISARFSGFWINDWKIMLDAGLSSKFNPEHIFISHTHNDHICRLACILTGLSKKPVIYVPYGTGQCVKNYLHAVSKLTLSFEELENGELNKYAQIIECNPGDTFNVQFSKKRFQIKIFQTDHTINSVGFAFSEYKNKLKKEFINLPKDKIRELAHDKIALTEEILDNVLVYTGDTRNSIFNNNILNWDQYKVIITECTFIQDLSPDINASEHANKKGHNYLQAIEQTAKKYHNPLFILCHWSARYNKEEIKALFENKKYNNIIPYLNIKS